MIDEVLLKTGLMKSQIDDIVLVGGAMCIPKIQNIIKDHFPG